MNEDHTKKQKSILVVEDDSSLASALYDELTRNEFQVEVARTGSEFIASIEKHIPDLILLDIEIPGMNGLEALQQIKAEGKIGNTPVIVLTNYDDANRVSTAIAEGVFDYRIKTDIKINDVVGLVKSKLEQ